MSHGRPAGRHWRIYCNLFIYLFIDTPYARVPLVIRQSIRATIRPIILKATSSSQQPLYNERNWLVAAVFSLSRVNRVRIGRSPVTYYGTERVRVGRFLIVRPQTDDEQKRREEERIKVIHVLHIHVSRPFQQQQQQQQHRSSSTDAEGRCRWCREREGTGWERGSIDHQFISNEMRN